MSAGGAAVQWGVPPIALSAWVTWCLFVVVAEQNTITVRFPCQYAIIHDAIAGIHMQPHYIAVL